MKKITVWSNVAILRTTGFLIFLIYWCQFAYRSGYKEQVSFWLFFPTAILLFSLLLLGQVTTIEVAGNRLEVRSFFGIRKNLSNWTKSAS